LRDCKCKFIFYLISQLRKPKIKNGKVCLIGLPFFKHFKKVYIWYFILAYLGDGEAFFTNGLKYSSLNSTFWFVFGTNLLVAYKSVWRIEVLAIFLCILFIQMLFINTRPFVSINNSIDFVLNWRWPTQFITKSIVFCIYFPLIF
jgi:hypothetical protein